MWKRIGKKRTGSGSCGHNWASPAAGPVTLTASVGYPLRCNLTGLRRRQLRFHMTPHRCLTPPRFAFGLENTTKYIGPGIGYQASLIAVQNIERSYLYKCHGIRAELVFGHRHTEETVKLPGWFASIHSGKIVEKPVESLTLDSKELSRTWLILHVMSHLEGGGQYRFPAPSPVPDPTPLSDWTIGVGAGNRLTYGQWQIEVAVRSDGPDKLDQTENIQAE